MKSNRLISQLTGLILLLSPGCEEEKPVTLPELSTLPLKNITSVSATSGGSIIRDGGSIVTGRGVCWSTSFNPTIADNITMDGTGAGSFESLMTGLNGGTNYYLRAYATNSAGTAYGNKILFIAPVTDIDGNVYGTAQIGTQVWMTENLKTTKFSDNSKIPNITGNASWISLSTPAFCWYKNGIISSDQKYGALYNWFAVNTGLLCPTGWHVPEEADWKILTDYLGGEIDAGGKLKEQGITHWISPNIGASNTFGFTALPAGYRSGLTSGSFWALGYIGWWWADTEADPNWARTRVMAFDASEIARGQGLKRNGYSVRCIKN